jgi:hypothetical protein
MNIAPKEVNKEAFRSKVNRVLQKMPSFRDSPRDSFIQQISCLPSFPHCKDGI